MGVEIPIDNQRSTRTISHFIYISSQTKGKKERKLLKECMSKQQIMTQESGGSRQIQVKINGL